VSIGRKKIGKNDVVWLVEGDGSRGETVLSPSAVASSLSGLFSFRAAIDDKPGLRVPQLGALHAILAAKTTEDDEPTTIVMPTGTGKTETMLSLFAVDPVKTLVMVPSDALRQQTVSKFQTFGVLPQVGVLAPGFLAPVVGVMRSGITEVDEADEFADAVNVVVATAAALARCSDEVLARLVERFDQLLVDEAHHVAARTWRRVADAFLPKPVVQFTATPFREDGEYLGGRLRYVYPLRLAQRDGYFSTINYKAVTDIGQGDRSLAESALQTLRNDLNAGFDHVLMARVNSITRADEVIEIYSELAADLRPVRIDSKMAKARQAEALALMRSRESRVVVCVDMLGEGFDLPALKVAAIHDHHKSLAVTLQFVGRFARVGDETLGEASVFVARPAGDIDDRLLRLYSDDPDWNVLICDLTEAEVAREQERSEFEEGFGQVPTEVAMRNIQPKMSTVVYRSSNLEWHPERIPELVGQKNLLTKRIAVNNAQRVLWYATAETSPVPWGEFATFSETTHHLYLVHADADRGLLYINSSNKEGTHDALARTIGGDDVELIRGNVVYRVLGRVQRRVPTNIGLLDTVNRNRRFSMHVGADVVSGFDVTAAQKSKTNIYAHGYMNGGRVAFGASRRMGRVWSHRVAPDILAWVRWAEGVGDALTDETISVESVMDGFIIPRAATSRPDLVPLGVEWPFWIIGTASEGRQVSHNGVAHALIDLELVVTRFESDGPLEFSVRSPDWELDYRIDFTDDGPPRYVATGSDATVELPNGEMPLSQYMTTEGMTVYFEQEALLTPDGDILQPDRGRPRFPTDALNPLDWQGVNMRKEVQGPARDADSIQRHLFDVIAAERDWDVVIDDHGSGEIADLVFLKRDDHALHVLLIHCKAAGGEPGSRVSDLYEVCGQAAKSHKARGEIDVVLRKLLRRERKRQERGAVGILQGTADDLLTLVNSSRILDPSVVVAVAQPGLSAEQMSREQSELLGCTNLYLSETYSSGFRVFCSS
jgi:superfamily II DNA or RNA helicase